MKNLPYIFTLAAMMLLNVLAPQNTYGQNSHSFVVLHQGYHSKTQTYKHSRVIRTQQEYAETLALYSEEQAQEIDFASGQVLLVDMGTRRSGGFWVEVRSVLYGKKVAVTANVDLVRPGRTCFTESGLTNPYQFVYIPTRAEILVSERLITFQC